MFSLVSGVKTITVAWGRLVKSGRQGGVGHMEEWATGRSWPHGGVSHMEEGATGRSEPHGGVGHMEEWATGRIEPCNFSPQVTDRNPV